jgi:hypothetical protein
MEFFRLITGAPRRRAQAAARQESVRTAVWRGALELRRLGEAPQLRSRSPRTLGKRWQDASEARTSGIDELQSPPQGRRP